jgi:ubiquinone biosynthesis protein
MSRSSSSASSWPRGATFLPSEFTDELSSLQNDAAQVPWPQVKQVLRSELGAEVDEVFATFDHTPLAAASIAQVTRGHAQLR